MNVPDARRHGESGRPEHLDDPQVFGPVLDDDPAMGQRVRQRGIDNDLRRGLARESGTTPAEPRTSLAVCAKASGAHRANAIATRGTP
jgi:hypothetical protein